MDSLSVYQKLADCYDRIGQASMRDRFLILAADAALEGGQPTEAERFRQRLLQGSRHHMLRPYASFAEAVQAPDVQTYLRDLRLNYPLEVARQLLESLQGGNEAPGAALHETKPIGKVAPLSPPRPADVAAPIPPTMPLMDTTGPARKGDLAGSQQWQQRTCSARPEDVQVPLHLPSEADTYPIREEQTPAAPASPSRPLGQPLPGRAPLSRQAGSKPAGPAPLARPATGGPAATPPRIAQTMALPRTEAPRPASGPRAAPLPAPQHEAPAQGGAWLNMLLVGVVFTAGLALLVFALARPFLPPAWLP